MPAEWGRWAAMKAEAAAGSLALGQVVPRDPEPPVRKTTEGVNRCPDVLLLPNATMCRETHRSVHRPRIRSHYCRGAAPTVTASGATSAAVASAAGAAPAGWRTTSRRSTRGPRSRQTPHSGCRPTACEAQGPRSYLVGVHRNSPSLGTWWKQGGTTPLFMKTPDRGG